jgi:hypothetical protein
LEKEMKKFRDFESAREFVQKLGLKNYTQWREYCKSGNKSNDIPSAPNYVYKKEWKGWGDFLGTGTIAHYNKVYRSFNEAREFVQKLGLKSGKEWSEYCKSGEKPENIPASPNRTYKKDWKGNGNWLGTGTISNRDKVFRPFHEAQEFVQKLELKDLKEWREYCNSGDKPDDIPKSPNYTYKKDFKGVGDWLGTGRIADKDKMNKLFLPFTEAREFVQKLKLKNFSEWQKYCKSGNKPDNIPSTPNNTYKKKGYLNLGDWLGTGNVASYKKQHSSFAEAREFARKLKLKNQKEWMQYCKSDNKPDDIFTNPQRTYKKEWKGWGDFLGNGNVSSRDRQWRPFKEAREFVRSLGLKGYDDWYAYCKSGNKPDDIPSNPSAIYKEWKKK